jgi:hypothetical protein
MLKRVRRFLRGLIIGGRYGACWRRRLKVSWRAATR